MPNTVTQRTLLGSGSEKNIVRSIHIVSDGTEESDLVIYDNSAFVGDVSKGSLLELWVSGSDCVARLEWDQTTDSPAFVASPSNGGYWDFRSFGGIGNPNGTGATGDLVLTTANLDSGDELMIIIRVAQN
jgi:hypothetical protein